MSKITTTTIGIDYDPHSIRTAVLKYEKSGRDDSWSIVSLDEIRGNFGKDEELVEGLKRIKGKFGSGGTIVSCVSGKQTYAAQIQFRKLPENEMKTALRFEIRKNLPFDSAGSTIDYQFLPTAEKKGESLPMMVTAVSNVLLNRHLRSFEKAGVKPDVVDVFPLTVANAFWAACEAGDAGENAQVILHIGPDISTLIIESHDTPFYNRYVYFTAAELFGDKADPNMASRERERRIGGLVDEIVRSLAFYETTYRNRQFKSIHVLGDYLEQDILTPLSATTGLTVNKMDLVKHFEPARTTSEPGKYDVAIALAMRTEP